MPNYAFKCPKCLKTWDELVSFEKKAKVKCACGAKAKALLSAPPCKMTGFTEYANE